MKTIFYSKNNCPICSDLLNNYDICDNIEVNSNNGHFFNLNEKYFQIIKDKHIFSFDYVKKRKTFEIEIQTNNDKEFLFERDDIYSIYDANNFVDKFISNIVFL